MANLDNLFGAGKARKEPTDHANPDEYPDNSRYWQRQAHGTINTLPAAFAEVWQDELADLVFPAMDTESRHSWRELCEWTNEALRLWYTKAMRNPAKIAQQVHTRFAPHLLPDDCDCNGANDKPLCPSCAQAAQIAYGPDIK